MSLPAANTSQIRDAVASKKAHDVADLPKIKVGLKQVEDLGVATARDRPERVFVRCPEHRVAFPLLQIALFKTK